MQMRGSDNLASGYENGFAPLQALDLNKVSSFSGLLAAMSRTAFAGRAAGRAADVLCTMVADPHCLVVATFSGAMTIAKQGLVIAELISKGCINVVVTTGAIVCHELVQELGNVHFERPATWNDQTLYAAGYDRVYDTIELEKSLDKVEQFLFELLSKRKKNTALSSCELCRLLAQQLIKKGAKQGFIQEAYRKNVPIFIPAFTDCELGLDLALYNNRAGQKDSVDFAPLLDLDAYIHLVGKAKRLGILTIGGGVPRNWAQQVGPYFEVLQRRAGRKHIRPIQFQYGVRICPEPVQWGGLSGCTYSEGVSWGKFVAPKNGGQFAEVLCDATVVLPLLVLAVLERLGLREKDK